MINSRPRQLATNVLTLVAISLPLACTPRPAPTAGVGSTPPPTAPTRPVTDTYFGTPITDPYRYMENLASPEVQSWIKAQANYARQTLDAIPIRDALLARIRQLDSGAPYTLHVLRRWPALSSSNGPNGDLHYLKTLATGNLAKVYFKPANSPDEKLLIDPEKLSTPGKHVALEFVIPSPNARYIAYGLAASGSEQTTLHILDTQSGQDLPETIDRMESDYTPPFWLADSTGFVYSRRRDLPPSAPPTEIYKRSQSFLHHLNTDPKSDALLLAKGHPGSPELSETDFPSIVLPLGSKYAIGKIKHGDANQLSLFAAPVDSLTSPNIPWKQICDASNEVVDFAVHADQIYLVTASGAPRFKVVATSLESPNFPSAQTIIPPSQAVVEHVAVARDALYIATLDAGLNHILRLPYTPGAKPTPIQLPPDQPSGYAVAIAPDIDGAFIATASWTHAGKLYAFNPADNSLTDTHLQPPGQYDNLPGFESKEVMVTSHDGVKVPLSIIFKSGIALDGSHPTLVSGYGAYGMVSSPHFSPSSIAWLERGGILAHAHVRGGGEFGEEWHLAGQKATKPNTWKDFLACCQYLVDQKYTSPQHLAGTGGSAGGILIGRAITERPDLFGAAIINVGCTDMLRMETTTNGVPNIPEFGSVTTKSGFDALYEMSAYAHVTPGTKYPAILLTHGINDPRVEPWMSAKMTARLQAATSSHKPILFRVDYDAGHGIGSTKKQRQEQQADQYAFLLWQLNNP